MDTLKLSQRFQPYLMVHERIIWSSRPKQGLTLTGKDALLIPFSLMWGGFAIFWNVGVWLLPHSAGSGADTEWFFKLWGLPFLAIGLYMMAGRFFHDALIRKKLFYAVTDRRVLVLRGSKIKSLDVNRLPRLELAEYRDGTGTVSFEANNLAWGGVNGFSWWVPALDGTIKFFRVTNPRQVYELIRDQGHVRA